MVGVRWVVHSEVETVDAEVEPGCSNNQPVNVEGEIPISHFPVIGVGFKGRRFLEVAFDLGQGGLNQGEGEKGRDFQKTNPCWHNGGRGLPIGGIWGWKPKPPKKGVAKHVANSCKPFFNILRHVACVIPKVFPPCVEARCW